MGVPWARITPADPGVLGRPDGAPYDRILVSAMARDLPTDLVEQLGDAGLLVVPVDGQMLLVAKVGATTETDAPGSRVSATNWRFNASGHRRRLAPASLVSTSR